MLQTITSYLKTLKTVLCLVVRVPHYCFHKTRSVKGKVVPVLFLTEHHAMKAYGGSAGIAP